MSAQENAQGLLLELSDFATRRTRAELVEHALRTALMVTESDAAVFLAPSARSGERLVLHSGSDAPSLVPAHATGSEVSGSLRRTAGISFCPTSPINPDAPSATAARGSKRARSCSRLCGSATPRADISPVYRRSARARFGLADSRTMLLLAAWLGLALESLRCRAARRSSP